MLTPEYLLRVSEGAEEIASALHTDMIKQVTSRILARQAKGYDYLLTAADRWRLESIMETGALRNDLIKEIAKYTNLEKKEIGDAFKDAGIKSMNYDNSVYRAAGMPDVPSGMSPYMVRLMQRNYEATMGEWSNFTRTTADATEQAFIDTMDQVYNRVTSGGVGYVQAYVDGIDSLAKNGLYVHYPSGHRDTIETATLRCVRTGVSQATAQVQVARMDELGVDLVLVTSHMGARPSHQEWQGKVYSRSGNSKKYPDFVSSTGYGTGPGLCGWNCRHSFFPYFEGQGNPYERYDDEENKELYERTQQQRAMERGIRKTKREREVLADAAEKAPDDETKAKLRESLGKTEKRLKKQNKAYREYCDKYDLRPLPERLRIGRAGGAAGGAAAVPEIPAPVIPPEPVKVELGKVGTFYPKKHVDKITKLLDDAPDDFKKVWNKCSSHFNPQPAKRGAAYYQPQTGGVVLNINSAGKGSVYQPPYQVVFHEYGHNIDYVLNEMNGGSKLTPFSETYKENLFGKTLKNEVSEMVENFAKENGLMTEIRQGQAMARARVAASRGQIGKDEVVSYAKKLTGQLEPDVALAERMLCEKLKEEHSLLARSDLSDMLEACFESEKNYPLGVGHGRGYWARTKVNTEAFAEMYSATISSPESLEVIKKYLPKSYDVFSEMLKEVT